LKLELSALMGELEGMIYGRCGSTAASSLEKRDPSAE
jgi:hypothetical protein